MAQYLWRHEWSLEDRVTMCPHRVELPGMTDQYDVGADAKNIADAEVWAAQPEQLGAFYIADAFYFSNENTAFHFKMRWR